MLSFYSNLVIALLGITLPLFIQALQGIDNKYNSHRISLHFKQECVFILFEIVLIVDVVGITMAYLFQNYCVLTPYLDIAIAIAIGISVFCLFKLFALILIYHNPEKLLKRICDSRGKCDQEKDEFLLCIFDIAKYGSVSQNRKIYEEATNSIYDEIKKQLGNAAYEKVSFSCSLSKTLTEACNVICDENKNYFRNSFFFADVWYISEQPQRLSQEATLFIWEFIKKIIDSNKQDWFEEYWKSTCFSQSKLLCELRNNDNYNESDYRTMREYKFFHIATGGLVIAKHSIGILKYMLSYTYTSPPKYSLLDNTADEIWEDLELLHDYQKRPFYRSKTYMMPNVNNPVDTYLATSYKIKMFLCLLIVRLYYLDYNVSYCEPTDLTYQNDTKQHRKMAEEVIKIMQDDEFHKLIIDVGYKTIFCEKAIEDWQKYTMETTS